MSKEQRAKSLDLFYDEFGKESERAKVILSAAMLDEALLAVLEAHFLPNASSSDSLFDGPNAPMSAFSSRIDFAYRLGLISKKLSRDLHIIRRIRNEFAHNVSGCTFNSSSVANRVATLRKSSTQLIEWSEQNKKEKFESIRVFQEVVAWIIFHLRGLVSKIDCVKEAEEEWGYSYKEQISQEKKPEQKVHTKTVQN